MEFLTSKLLTLLLLTNVLLCSSSPVPTAGEIFLQCFSNQLKSDPAISKVIYTPNTTSYSSLLESSIQNPRFLSPQERKPLFIIAPTNISHIQASVLCSKEHGFQIRTRSGGHDYEGQSYLSDDNFVLIDLSNLQAVDVNVEESTAWVQAGATVGQVYYRIAEKSASHGFSAGICPTIGVGGHFSGGGIGTLMRKYGIAADSIIDAYIVDVKGRALDRKSMGEDLFWAIRGGGAASFGVVFSWKIKLVPVPPVVTVFTLKKTQEEGAIKLVNRWQQIADKFDENLFIRVILSPTTVVNKEGKNVTTTEAAFNSMFLGGVEALLPLMNKSFPELGLQQKDCEEMSWVRSILYFAGLPHGEKDPTNVLLDRVPHYPKQSFKGKSDFLTAPIPEDGLVSIWNKLVEDQGIQMIIDPLGGKLSEISESQIAFPHRKGNLYNIQYILYWNERDEKASEGHINWINGLYKQMTPYVSKSPRAAYVNYRDLDLGRNEHGHVSYPAAAKWGDRYFKNNFRRLAIIKGKVDPANFFRNEQSIPPLIILNGTEIHDAIALN